MKWINLLAQVRSARYLSLNQLQILARVESGNHIDNVRKEEYEDLYAFVHYLGIDNYPFYDYFYFNYSIPHIGKEFDLLRLADNYNINIELKSKKAKEAILKQLKQNEMYLSFLEKKAYCFTYEVSTNQLYQLIQGELVSVEKEVLINLLKYQQHFYRGDLDQVFHPSKYLVNPFQDPLRLINHHYFLNQEQAIRKSEIIESLQDNPTKIILLKGSTGSGKTLLLYDIIQDLENSIIYHNGLFTQGQEQLKEIYHYPLYHCLDDIPYSTLTTLIVDETQYMPYKELEKLFELQEIYSFHLVFAYDPLIQLDEDQDHQKVRELLEERKTDVFLLKGKVRSSKEVNYFVERLFDLRRHTQYIFHHMHIYHFEKDANDYIRYLENYRNYHYIDYHKQNNYIGIEFEKVCVKLDSTFYYNDEWCLKCKQGSTRSLYEALSRAKTHITIIVEDNISLYENLLYILENGEE